MWIRGFALHSCAPCLLLTRSFFFYFPSCVDSSGPSNMLLFDARAFNYTRYVYYTLSQRFTACGSWMETPSHTTLRPRECPMVRVQAIWADHHDGYSNGSEDNAENDSYAPSSSMDSQAICDVAAGHSHLIAVRALFDWDKSFMYHVLKF